MRWKRWIIGTLVLLVVLAGAAYIGLLWYLRSSAASQMVARELSTRLGADVRIDEVDLGLFGASSARGVKLYDDQTEEPWLSVDQLSLDATALQLRSGTMPDRVELTGVRARLRFDCDGKLLTRLPEPKEEAEGKPLPVLALSDSRLTIEQEGRSPFELSGIEAELRQKDGGYVLEGELDDPDWGAWSLSGTAAGGGKNLALNLSAPRAQIEQSKLEKVPFVPDAVWRHVRTDGPMAVTLAVRLESDGFHFHLDLIPDGARVEVPDIGMIASDVRGKVVVDDKLVTLRDLRGRASGGEVEVKGELNFRPEPDRLAFTIAVKKADLQDVTRTWPLPPQLRKLSGKLTGRADLVILAGDPEGISGEGRGRIDDARLDGLPTSGPVTLRLFYDRGKPRFDSTTSSGRRTAPWAEYLLAVALVQPQPPAKKPVRLLDYPGRAACLLNQGVRLLSQSVADAGNAAADLTRRLAKGRETPTYFEANFGFKDIDLHTLVSKLGVALPFEVAGKGSLQLKVALPVNVPGDLSLYRVSGTVQLERLNVAGLELEQIDTRVKLDRGVLELLDLKGRLPGGGEGNRFDGTARLQLEPLGDLSARVNLKDLALSPLKPVLPAEADPRGRASGTLEWRAPAPRVKDPATWKATGTVRLTDAVAFGFVIDSASGDVAMDRGEVVATNVRAQRKGLSAAAAGRLALDERRRYALRVATDRTDLAGLQDACPHLRLPGTVRGKLTLTGDLKGTLSPLTVDASGEADAAPLQIEGFKFASFKAGWKADGDTLRLSNLRAGLYGGEVTGTTALPLSGKGEGTFDLAVAKIEAGGLLAGLDLGGLPIEGRLDGTVKGRMGAAAPGKARTWTASLDVRSETLRLRGIPAEQVRGTVELKEGVARYRLQGSALGGTFEIDGTHPAQPPAPPPPGAGGAAQPPPAGRGRFTLSRARVGELVRSLGLSMLEPLAGVLDVTFEYTTGPGATGRGRAEVRDLRWGGEELATRVGADLVLRDSELRLSDLDADVAGGDLRAVVVLDLAVPNRGYFTLNLERADLRRLLAGFPDLRDLVDGPVSLTVRAGLGREWRGTGTVGLSRGRIDGVEASDLRLPFSFTWAPERGSGQVDVRDGGAIVGSGRASVQTSYTWGAASRLEGLIRFNNVELRQMLAAAEGLAAQVGAGRMTGRLDFHAAELRSINDVQARLEAELNQAQALQLPVFRQIVPYLGGLSASTVIQKGDVRATLGGGVWRIARLTLESPVLRLMIQGSVTVQGRLDLDVVARTGQIGVNPLLLRVLGLSLGGPIGSEALVRASAWLSNRSVQLHVGGTLSSPVIQVRPLPLLTEEAIRFFLLYAFPAAPTR